MGDVPKAIARTRRRPKSITTKAAASTSLERVVRCCTPSPQDPTGPLPVSQTLDDDHFRGVTERPESWLLSAGRQAERPSGAIARSFAGWDIGRSGLRCDQGYGQVAPYSTVMMTDPVWGVKRISALQAFGPLASSTTLPSSSGEPASTVQPLACSAFWIAALAAVASRLAWTR